MDAVELFWWILIAYTTFIRMKYVWTSLKIFRTKSCKDVSTKAHLHTVIEYFIMFFRNLGIADLMDVVFWGFGIFTTSFAAVMLWKYRENKADNPFRWLLKGLRGKLRDEGGIFW